MAPSWVFPLLALLAFGCNRSSRVLAASAVEFVPGADPGPQATLRFGPFPGSDGKLPRGTLATEFDVELSRKVEDRAVTLLLNAQGETLERERYEGGESAFRVVGAGDDAFAPGIDLLRWPTKAGDRWDWNGRLVYAGVARPARANVVVTADGEEVRSTVALFVTTDPGRPELRRDLTFWFRKGHGVVRRAFGAVSSRRPQGEAWRP